MRVAVQRVAGVEINYDKNVLLVQLRKQRYSSVINMSIDRKPIIRGTYLLKN